MRRSVLTIHHHLQRREGDENAATVRQGSAASAAPKGRPEINIGRLSPMRDAPLWGRLTDLRGISSQESYTCVYFAALARGAVVTSPTRLSNDWTRDGMV